MGSSAEEARLLYALCAFGIAKVSSRADTTGRCPPASQLQIIMAQQLRLRCPHSEMQCGRVAYPVFPQVLSGVLL